MPSANNTKRQQIAHRRLGPREAWGRAPNCSESGRPERDDT